MKTRRSINSAEGLANGNEDDYQGRLVAIDPLVAGVLANLTIDCFDCVSGTDRPGNRRRKVKQRDNVNPLGTPLFGIVG